MWLVNYFFNENYKYVTIVICESSTILMIFLRNTDPDLDYFFLSLYGMVYLALNKQTKMTIPYLPLTIVIISQSPT